MNFPLDYKGKTVRLQGYGKGSFDLDYKGKAVLLQGYGKGSFDLDCNGKSRAFARILKKR